MQCVETEGVENGGGVSEEEEVDSEMETNEEGEALRKKFTVKGPAMYGFTVLVLYLITLLSCLEA